MTTATLRPAPSPPPAAGRRASRRRPKNWRFLRAVVPFAVVFLIFVGTGIAWVVDHAGPNDRDWLEPASTTGIGSERLATELTGRGVSITRYGATPGAVLDARQGSETLMVTAPDEIYDGYLAALSELPPTDRVVLVEPSAGTLDTLGMGVRPAGSRWTTGAAAPGRCALAESAAGTAAVLGTRYKPTGAATTRVARCYGGGLVGVAARPRGDNGVGGPEFVIVGAGDVFRNDRQAEHHNRALAAALLGARHRIAWLSLHRPEPAPPHLDDPGGDPLVNGGNNTPAPTPTASGGSGSGSGSGSASGSSGTPPDPLWSAFPPWAWALVAQLLLAAVGLALWRARRLAVPVAEPLPVVVRSAETVSGRGRLYHRAAARPAALNALRAGALARMQPALRSQLSTDATHEQVVAAVADRSGWPAEQVTAVLYGPAPTDDAGLAAAVDALDALTRAVVR